MDKFAFDWTLIRSFLAVIEAGSLMEAARRLGAHQPTLSRHMAELEAQLGVPLFERTRRGLTPTAAALAMISAARQMKAGADALSLSLEVQRHATTGTVRISSSQVVATWLLPPVLVALREAEPGIDVELVASNQLSNLLEREADIAVRMVRPRQGALIARKLADVPLTAAAHASYLERAGIPRKPKDLLRHRLVGYDRDNTILQGFARLGVAITREDFALRTDDQAAYVQLVAAGAGIGFVAAYTLRNWPDVQAVLPDLQIPPLPCWLAVHREVRASGVVRRVYDFLAEAIPREVSRTA